MNIEIIQIIGSIILALIPALVWGYIFYKKQPEDKGLVVITFISGAIAVFPILVYKYLWQFFPWINAFQYTEMFQEDIIGFTRFTVIPLSVIMTFMLVGVLEEAMKIWGVKVVDRNKFRHIDDAIEFCIIAALGFSFAENILYFYNIWAAQGPEQVFVPFLFRSAFSTFAHLMFSGIYGYYYGIAHFAKPILQEEIRKKRYLWTKTLHKITHLKGEIFFREEKLIEGFLIAVTFHAIFNIFLEMNWTFLIVPFLVSGYITLSYLFIKKENHKRYDKLHVRVKEFFI
ncbi:MAG: PrsW family glutamic-type intramembrane protease [Patescibacteria group bacterium]